MLVYVFVINTMRSIHRLVYTGVRSAYFLTTVTQLEPEERMEDLVQAHVLMHSGFSLSAQLYIREIKQNS